MKKGELQKFAKKWCEDLEAIFYDFYDKKNIDIVKRHEICPVCNGSGKI